MVVENVNKEELIFNIYKNDVIEDCLRFKYNLTKKYGLSENKAHDIFVKIANYQIDTYGVQLQRYRDDDGIDDFHHKNIKAKQRKQKKRHWLEKE